MADTVHYPPSDQFPIHYNSGGIKVFSSLSGEVFVTDTTSGATMRISRYLHGKRGLQFTTDNRVEPVRVTNMIGWRVGA